MRTLALAVRSTLFLGLAVFLTESRASAQIVESYSDSLTTYKPTAKRTIRGVRPLQLLHEVTIDRVLRSKPGFPPCSRGTPSITLGRRGRFTTACDASDHRFTYSSTSLNGTTRLTQVKDRTKSRCIWSGSPQTKVAVGVPADREGLRDSRPLSDGRRPLGGALERRAPQATPPPAVLAKTGGRSPI
jgi:hypothetical protein